MSTQARFAAALLDPGLPVPEGITSWNGSDPAQRFAVYRNNVTVSLIEALGEAFPVVRAMVGEDFFRDMARLYLRRSPPRSPVLAGYGADFADFIAAFPPARGLAYLPDLARLEHARRRAYHAADAVSLPAARFAEISEMALPGLRVTLHPSAEVLVSPHAIVSLWAAHQGIGVLERIDPAIGEDALVVRPALEVLVMRLPPGAATLISELGQGASLAEAAAVAFQTTGFALPEALAVLITSGAVTDLTLEHEDTP